VILAWDVCTKTTILIVMIMMLVLVMINVAMELVPDIQ